MAVERIGMPEGQYNLFHCALALASCKKSRKVADTMANALNAAKNNLNAPVPPHLINASTNFMKDAGFGKDYKWEANFLPNEGFLPKDLKNLNLFN